MKVKELLELLKQNDLDSDIYFQIDGENLGDPEIFPSSLVKDNDTLIFQF